MARVHRLPMSVRGALISMLLCGGCASSAVVSNDAVGELPEEIQGTWPRDSEFAVYSATAEDVGNRYASVVVVQSEGTLYGFCSGVLIDPRLVLTAGHCVCTPTQATPALVDSSSCIKRAQITAYLYEKRGKEYVKRPLSRAGTVIPHDKFKARMAQNEYGRYFVVDSTTDLAAIVLDEPEGGGSRVGIPVGGFKMPEGEVQLKEPIIIVGYGLDSIENGRIEKRLWGTNRVTGVFVSNLKDPADEDVVFTFGWPGAHAAGGDSGGPCYREDKKGNRWLVGIISRGTRSGNGSQFTSIFPHLQWVESLKKQAGRAL